MLVASRMTRKQRMCTFIFFASLFKAGNLPVLELGSMLQLPVIPVLFVQGVGQPGIGGKRVLKAKKTSSKIHSHKPLSRLKKFFFVRQSAWGWGYGYVPQVAPPSRPAAHRTCRCSCDSLGGESS